MKWLGKFPDSFLAEIAGQPAALRRAADALSDQVRTIETLSRTPPRVAIFTGMGGSYDACYPAVNELAVRGVLALHVDAAELLHFRSAILRPSTVLVTVSQSGESAEIVRLAESVVRSPERPVTLSITNGLANELAQRSDLRLDTRAGAEFGPSTMTFGASLAHLAAVAGALAGVEPSAAVERARSAAEQAATAVEAILERGEPVAERLTEVVRDREVIAVLGRGPARAAAEMGALTLKESGVMAESFATAAFRHGPLELAGPDLAAIVIATERETRPLDLALAADLVRAGASVAVLAPGGEAPPDALGVAVPAMDRLLGSAASIVPIQLLARRLAGERGRIPGGYTRASKVTTHE